MVEAGTRALNAALRLDRWMRARDYAGYDPFDVLGSPLLRGLSFGSRWLAVGWTQVGKRLPARARPLLGVPRARNAKGMGLALAAHVRLHEATGRSRFRESAEGFVRWLAETTAHGQPGAGWGYPFPWANRAFYAPAGTPASVPTAFIGHGLLDAAERLRLEPAAALARRAGEFVQRGLNRVPGPSGTFCFSYTPVDRRAVHNANLLAASLLARLAASPDGGAGAGSGARDDALAAARYTVTAQRADGSWPYGAARRDGWVDSYHTSYSLVALRRIGRALGTDEFEGAVRRGAEYWRRTFVTGPAVRPAPGAAYPIETHGVAHTILALLELEPELPGAREDAVRLVDWCLEEMRDPDGYFYNRMHRLRTDRSAYMRWTQAWMLRALAEVAARAAGPERAPAGAAVDEDEAEGSERQ